MSTTSFDQIISDAVNSAISQRGHINILIAGNSGVGKSTLINAMFQGDFVETGSGRPVTQSTREVTKEGVPLTIFDTRGLETAKYKETIGELEKLVKERSSDRDPARHIHVAWLCIDEGSRRVQDADSELVQLLGQHVPIVGVITKSQSDRGFRAEVLQLLPGLRSAVRVRAVKETLDEGQVLEQMGLEALIEATSEVIPDGVRGAFAAVQKANIEFKKNQAHKIVAAAATSAAAAGASPIPLSDALLLAPIQIAMFAKISSVFGLDVTKSTLGTLVSSTLGVSAATFAGRTLVSNALKLFPGIGSIAGGAISGATAAALTVAIGESYITTLAELSKESPDSIPDISKVAEKLKENLGAHES